LFLFALSDFLFYTTFVILCIKSFIPLFVVLSGFFVVYTKHVVTIRINNKLQQSDLSPWLFILDPLYVIYLFSIFMISLFRPKQEWK
jgi:hypothetical protein